MTSERKIFQIFRAGTHVSMSGVPLTFSALDVDLMAAAYSKARLRAPLVLGHPPDNRPEYGETESLFAKGGALYAEAAPCSSLVSMVRKKMYNHVSACLIAPDSPGNPAPGAYYLRHIGFLGAHPPAVKGMAPLDFAEHGGHILFAEGYEIQPDSSRSAPALAAGNQFSEERTRVFNLAADYRRACPQMDFIEAVRRAEHSIFHRS